MTSSPRSAPLPAPQRVHDVGAGGTLGSRGRGGRRLARASARDERCHIEDVDARFRQFKSGLAEDEIGAETSEPTFQILSWRPSAGYGGDLGAFEQEGTGARAPPHPFEGIMVDAR